MMILFALSLVAAMVDGDSAMTSGDYEAAAQYYRAEIEAHPESNEAKFQLARALSFSNHRAEAIQLYTELLATQPNNSDVLLARGRTYTWENRWSEAEADIIAVTTGFPDYGDAWSALGDVYFWSDRTSDAVKAYGKWIAASPDNPHAYIARAKAYRSADNFDAARADFEAARAHGAPDLEIDQYLASLQRRRQVPEAEAPDAYKWFADLSYGLSIFPSVGSEAHYLSAIIRHYWKIWSLAFESLGSRRFGSYDYALALDAYVDLWPRAYANLRFQYSPRAILYPNDSYRIEIFQGILKGWELSCSYDRMDFGASDVNMYGVGLGKYIGNWYLRWRTLFIPSSAGLGFSNRALARYYFSGDADDYFEINGGFSLGGQFHEGTKIFEKTTGQSFGAVLQKYFHPRLGLKISYTFNNDNKYPLIENYISTDILTRW